MSAFGFSPTGNDILVDGIASWKVKWSGATPDDAYYDLGSTYDGVAALSTISRETSRKAPRPHAGKFQASAKFMDLCDTEAKVELLSSMMGNNLLAQSIATVSGKNFAGTMGSKWRFVIDGGYDANRYVELFADLNLLSSGFDTLMGSAPATGTPDSGDVLYGFDSLTTNNPMTSGVTALETRNAGETSWEAFPTWRNVKFTAETMGGQDYAGRTRGHSISVDIEADVIESATARLLLDTMAGGTPDVRVTTADGLIITIADLIGFDFNYSVGSNMDDFSFIKVSWKGSLLASDWAGVIGHS